MNKEKLVPCLSGRGITKIFGTTKINTVAVDHIDFDFYKGEVVSIVGESGSGKTTLAQMILGLISVTDGEIGFEGARRDLSSHKKKKEYWREYKLYFRIRLLLLICFIR